MDVVVTGFKSNDIFGLCDDAEESKILPYDLNNALSNNDTFFLFMSFYSLPVKYVYGYSVVFHAKRMAKYLKFPRQDNILFEKFKHRPILSSPLSIVS